MAESGVILPADSTGKALRTETQTTAFTTGAGGVVHQQVISLADPVTGAMASVGAEGNLWVVPHGGVRHNIAWTVQGYSVTASEAAPGLARSTDLAVTTTTNANPYTVTTGKTLRIQGLSVSGVILGTTVTASRVNIRAIPSGTWNATTSALQFSTRLGNPSIGTQAANYGLIQQDIDFADGMEFAAGSIVGFTAIATTAAMHSLDISVWGYEYP